MSNGVVLILPIAYIVMVSLLIYSLIDTRKRHWFFRLKMISSLLFLLMGVVFLLLRGKLTDQLAFIFGFALCVFGDYEFGLFNNHKRKDYFIVGTSIFLLGHVSFIFGLCKVYMPQSYTEIIIPVLAMFGTFFLLKNKNVAAGKMKPIMFVYAFFITTFFSRCIHYYIANRTIAGVLLAVGACFFLISDTLILFLYFYRKKRWSTHGWNIATYYLAMCFISISLLYI